MNWHTLDRWLASIFDPGLASSRKLSHVVENRAKFSNMNTDPNKNASLKVDLGKSISPSS